MKKRQLMGEEGNLSFYFPEAARPKAGQEEASSLLSSEFSTHTHTV